MGGDSWVVKIKWQTRCKENKRFSGFYWIWTWAQVNKCNQSSLEDWKYHEGRHGNELGWHEDKNYYVVTLCYFSYICTNVQQDQTEIQKCTKN